MSRSAIVLEVLVLIGVIAGVVGRMHPPAVRSAAPTAAPIEDDRALERVRGSWHGDLSLLINKNRITCGFGSGRSETCFISAISVQGNAVEFRLRSVQPGLGGLPIAGTWFHVGQTYHGTLSDGDRTLQIGNMHFTRGF